MMKLTGALGSCLAALVVVPTTALSPQESDGALTSLRVALDRTVQSLELLGGLRARVEAGERLPLPVLRELTEEPLPAGPKRDADLERLRTRVGLLQQELDLAEARSASGVPGTAPAPAKPASEPQPRPGVSRGLTPGELEELARLGAAGEAGASPAVPAVAPLPADPSQYSADPLLHAQACYRAGMYQRGVDVLQGDDSSPAVYWRARCLEQLGRLDQAVDLYQKLAARSEDPTWSQRAQANLEFVRWKQQFDERFSRTARGGGQQ